MSLHTPFRFDYVGSFLRPEDLKTARRQYEEGHISRDELRAVEDKEITDLVAKQKATGYHVITDGEFRRAYWHLDFMWGLQGIDHVELPHGYYFHGEETTHGTARCTGKISGENHPFVKDFLFVKQFEDENTIAKQTIPAPAQTLAELYREDNEKITRAIYPDEDELIEDIAAAYRTVLRDLYEAGCRNVQFNNCKPCDAFRAISTYKIVLSSPRLNNLYKCGGDGRQPLPPHFSTCFPFRACAQ